MIDPGHGGYDPGSLGSFTKEKNINLAIALKTGEYIEENIKNVTVIYTRKDDSTVDLMERPIIANKNNADLFISIHSNWWKLKSVTGAETYIMGPAQNEENLAVAMKENEVIYLEDNYSTKYQGFDPKSPESYIIFSLTQNVYQKQSTQLASKIQTQFTERVNRKDRGVKQAEFWVLYKTSMPSVLVETGFLTNPIEEKFLASEQGQDYIASAIFRACRDYMSEVDLRSNIKIDTISTASTPSTSKPAAITPQDIIFTVQVAAATKRTEIRPENFKGLANVVEIKTGERFRYVSGSYADYTEAVIYRKQIESIYPDAFVIALQNNKILPLQQALEQKRKK